MQFEGRSALSVSRLVPSLLRLLPEDALQRRQLGGRELLAARLHQRRLLRRHALKHLAHCAWAGEGRDGKHA